MLRSKPQYQRIIRALYNCGMLCMRRRLGFTTAFDDFSTFSTFIIIALCMCVCVCVSVCVCVCLSVFFARSVSIGREPTNRDAEFCGAVKRNLPIGRNPIGREPTNRDAEFFGAVKKTFRLVGIR